MRTAIRKALGTVVLGALLGYVVMAFGGPMVQQLALFGQREAPEARRYMIGVLQNEPETLSALSPRADLVSRALQFQRASRRRASGGPSL